jgi:hypothetical protein
VLSAKKGWRLSSSFCQQQQFAARAAFALVWFGLE